MSVFPSITVATAFIICATTAFAHQPYESSAAVVVEHENVELTVSTSAEIARMLVGAPPEEPSSLEDHRARLLEIAPQLYEVSSNRMPLHAERSFFSIKNGEAVFSIIYPAASPAGLGFRASYLEKLPLGYGGSIEVIDAEGNLLGRQPLLKKGETKNSFQLPDMASRNAEAGVGASFVPAAAESGIPAGMSQAAQANSPGRLALIAGLSLLSAVGFIIAWWLQRSSLKETRS